MAAVQALKWGGVTDEEANASATKRSEEILAGLKGRREELGYKCTLAREFSIVGADNEKRSKDLTDRYSREEEDKADRKRQRIAQAEKEWEEEKANQAERVKEEEEDALKRAADPEYAAKRMAEEEAAHYQKLVEERKEIEATFAAAEAKGETDAQERSNQQKAAAASLVLLEKERKKQLQKRQQEEAAEGRDVLSAYEQAKAAAARKEKAKLTVAPIAARGAVKMSFGKKSLF